MPLLFDIFNLYRTSTTLEQNQYALPRARSPSFQDTAAYAWMVTVIGAVILVRPTRART